MRKVIFSFIFVGFWASSQAQLLKDSSVKSIPIFTEPIVNQEPNDETVELKKKGCYEVYHVQSSQSLVETSGLVYASDGKFKGLWSQNDGGNAPCLFKLSPKLNAPSDTVSPTLRFCFNSIKNYDWEAIACHDDVFYIGDIGNNFGTRKELKIYKIHQLYSTINSIKEFNPVIDSIVFSYPDQTDFTFRRFHPFDAESMVVTGDSVYIFTKNWNNCNSNVYVFNINESHPTVFKRQTLKMGFLATDACLLGNRLFFVGYSFWGKQYIAEFDWHTKKRLNRRKIKLKHGQIEGICYNFELNDFVLSTESRKDQPAKIFRIR